MIENRGTATDGTDDISHRSSFFMELPQHQPKHLEFGHWRLEFDSLDDLHKRGWSTWMSGRAVGMISMLKTGWNR